jgi:hypothetical protein
LYCNLLSQFVFFNWRITFTFRVVIERYVLVPAILLSFSSGCFE